LDYTGANVVVSTQVAVLAALSLGVVVLCASACGREDRVAQRQQDKQQDRARQELASKREEAQLVQLAVRFEADRTWVSGSYAWTAEVQERLVGKTVAGTAGLSDVARVGQTFQVVLVAGDVFLRVGPVIEFALACDSAPRRRQAEGDSTAARLAGTDPRMFLPRYAFVGKVHTVRRVPDARELRWRAEGECLALEPVAGGEP
jgi:hypothetical protein